MCCAAEVEAAAQQMIACYQNGGKLLVCGNGGSASDSLHIVGELMKGFVLPRKLDENMQKRLREACPEMAEYCIENLQGVPFPVSWTVKMKKKQKETQDILSYHTQAAGCSDKARAKASGGRQPIEECGRTGL